MAGGRPPIFKTPEDLEDVIKQYFEHCKPKIENGELKSLGENITITGLALYLGFESRQSFYDYEKNDQYSYIIKRARLKVESEYEKKLSEKNPAGSIFALKNMGWSDKTEVEQSTTIKDQRLDLSKLSDEELRTLTEIQRKSGASEA